jgi:hypothetical protein
MSRRYFLFGAAVALSVVVAAPAFGQDAIFAPVPIENAEPATLNGKADRGETGPGEVTAIALILASITAVAYVGFTSTDWFRHDGADDIVKRTAGEGNRRNGIS